jgi:hypothetical protein
MIAGFFYFIIPLLETHEVRGIIVFGKIAYFHSKSFSLIFIPPLKDLTKNK